MEVEQGGSSGRQKVEAAGIYVKGGSKQSNQAIKPYKSPIPGVTSPQFPNYVVLPHTYLLASIVHR